MRAIARLVRGLDAGYHRIQRGKVAAQQRHAQLCRSFATVIRLVQSDWKIFVKPRSAPSTRAPSRSDVNANYMWPAQFKRLIARRWRCDRFRRRHHVVDDPAYVRYYWDLAASEGTAKNNPSWTADVGSFLIERVPSSSRRRRRRWSWVV